VTPLLRPLPARGRRLFELALLLNGLLLLTGLYVELHPRDRGDVWSAGGIVAIAVLNSAALTIARGGDQRAGAPARLRRIALISNGVLAAAASLLAVAEGLREWNHADLTSLALVVPPLVTILALRGGRSPGAGSGGGSL
jgi:hypothetical protein